jgi:hypothetical protein
MAKAKLKYQDLELCDVYYHSDFIPKVQAIPILDSIAQTYMGQEHVYHCTYFSNRLEAKQRIGNQVLFIVAYLETEFWKPLKARVKEEVYYSR